MTPPITNTGKVPPHTFSESLIIDGVVFNIGKWWLNTSGDDCWMIPFTRSGGLHSFTARCGDVKPSIANIRKAVIEQVKHLKGIGEEFDLACTHCNGSGKL